MSVIWCSFKPCNINYILKEIVTTLISDWISHKLHVFLSSLWRNSVTLLIQYKGHHVCFLLYKSNFHTYSDSLFVKASDVSKINLFLPQTQYTVHAFSISCLYQRWNNQKTVCEPPNDDEPRCTAGWSSDSVESTFFMHVAFRWKRARHNSDPKHVKWWRMAYNDLELTPSSITPSLCC